MKSVLTGAGNYLITERGNLSLQLQVRYQMDIKREDGILPYGCR
jgi:hypothetical protein